MSLPDFNQRVKDVIDLKANGSVSKFAKDIGISQQKINRLFNIDSRTNKYPTVQSDILTCIAEMFVDIDLRWLLTGLGEITQNHKVSSTRVSSINDGSCQLCKEKDRTINILQSHNIFLQNQLDKKGEVESKSKRHSA